jgi:hypothetical protein
MGNPTFNDVRLFLADLVQQRRSDILLLRSGDTYLQLFTQQHAEAEGLPSAQERARVPLAQELARVDVEHDNLGRTIYYYAEAHRHLPGLPDDARQDLDGLQRTFAPSLVSLNASYADEAARAQERRTQLDSWRDRLSRYTLADGRSLYQVVSDYVARGEELGTLLAARSVRTVASAEGGRRKAILLRNRIIGSVSRFRETLRDELLVRPELPRDLEARIFGYFDLLAAMRTRGYSEPTPPAPQTP